MVNNPLLTKCKKCGRRTKGKHYELIVAATPIMVMFFVIFAAVTIVLVSEHWYEGPSYVVAAIITCLVFLVPGIALFYYVRGLNYVCPECRAAINLDVWRQQVGAIPRDMDDGTEESADTRRALADHPQAMEIVVQYTNRTGSRPSHAFVEEVIDATVQERAGNLELARTMYERIGLHDQVERVGYRIANAGAVPPQREFVPRPSPEKVESVATCPYCGAITSVPGVSDKNELKRCGYCGADLTGTSGKAG